MATVITHLKALFDKHDVHYISFETTNKVPWLWTQEADPLTDSQIQTYAIDNGGSSPERLKTAIKASLNMGMPCVNIKKEGYEVAPRTQAPSSQTAETTLSGSLTTEDSNWAEVVWRRSHSALMNHVKDKLYYMGEFEAPSAMHITPSLAGVALVGKKKDFQSSDSDYIIEVWRANVASKFELKAENETNYDYKSTESSEREWKATVSINDGTAEYNLPDALSEIYQQNVGKAEPDGPIETYLDEDGAKLWIDNVVPGSPEFVPMTGVAHGHVVFTDSVPAGEQSESYPFERIQLISSEQIAEALENMQNPDHYLSQGYDVGKVPQEKKDELQELVTKLKENTFRARVVRYKEAFKTKPLAKWHSEWGELENSRELGGEPPKTVKQFDNKYANQSYSYILVLQGDTTRKKLYHVGRRPDGTWEELSGPETVASEIRKGQADLTVEELDLWLEQPYVAELPETVRIRAKEQRTRANPKVEKYMNAEPPADGDEFVEFFLHTRLNEDRKLAKFILYVDEVLAEMDSSDL